MQKPPVKLMRAALDLIGELDGGCAKLKTPRSAVCSRKRLARFFLNPGTFLRSYIHLQPIPEFRAARNGTLAPEATGARFWLARRDSHPDSCRVKSK